MISLKYIVFVLALFATALLGESIEKLSWIKIKTGLSEDLLFVSGNSRNDFYVQTLLGKLIHVKDGKTKLYPLPTKFDFIKTEYFQISDNEFFCAATTPNWKGEIYKIKNHVWQKYAQESLAPFRSFIKTSENQIYLYGDFGTLLSFKNNKWHKIEVNFESHIIAAVTLGRYIYLATRGDGVLLFDGKNFTRLTPSKNNNFIYQLTIIDSVVYGFSTNNKLFSYKKNIEKRITNNEIEQFFLTENLQSNFGFAKRIVYTENKRKAFDFPQNYNISEITTMHDNSIILLSKDGNVFINEINSKRSFVDFAPIYRVDDLPNSNNRGTQFFDANNDGINDLLLINKTFGNYLSLYQGVNNSAFANITSITNLPYNENLINLFTTSDFNKDNLNDIIIESKVESQQKLLFYQNLGNFRFKKTNEIVLPKDFQNLGIRDLTIFDYDRDGDEDIIVTAYYGLGDEPGYVLIYKNNYWGSFYEVDTTFKSKTRRWNQKFIFADINNNDTLDIFNATLWKNDRLYFGTDSGFTDKSLTHFSKQKKTETNNTLLFDYDNDADLDIITIGRGDFIRIYSNDSKGTFTEATELLFRKQYLNNRNIRATVHLNLGDFNNDSFTDILLSIFTIDSNYTTIFMNINGKFFEERPSFFELQNSFFLNSTISDFDNDGDLDIYGGTNNHNVLLINRLDNDNSIKLKLNGIISSTNALGSKVWVYQKDKLDSAKYLIGYKQLGTEKISKNAVNDYTLHFGLGKIESCDVKIEFLSNQTIIRKNVKSGSFLIINEVNLISAFFYKIPGYIYRFAIKTENQIYFLTIIFSHLILIMGLWYGFTNLKWSSKLTLVFTILNITLFWGSLYVSSFSKIDLIKFIIPLMLTLLITIIPITLFAWINKSTNKNISAYSDKLLELIISFSHGEWALRNLNSIILFCENRPNNWKENREFQDKLDIRLNTFKNMTSSSISEIIEYENLIGNVNDELINLETTSKETLEIINQQNVTQLSLSKLANNFTSIRNNVKTIRNFIYARFSSKPTEVINDLIISFESALEENNISISKRKRYPQEIPVLIKSYELANILDNLFQNSIRFLKDSTNKNISIELYKESPKIIIKFSNNGRSIDKGKWEVIFEHGYSEGGSTGQGLFNAREILKKYGGRMYVDVSNSEITTFKIELNEGIILS